MLEYGVVEICAGAGVRVKLDGELVLEPCEFQAERLTSRPGADLHEPVLRHLTSPAEPA